MKEVRYFYDPELSGELPQEETQHVLRVLRLGVGDEIFLMDGKGLFCRAEIVASTGHRCLYKIVERQPQEPAWKGHIHIAVAPTKLNDRMEWFAEKATEIGMDELTFLECQFSERRNVKVDRINKILISAVKQSHKAWCPKVSDMISFHKFVTEKRMGQKFICHCYEGEKPFLLDALETGSEATVMIGPEGDFSIEEVKLAEKNGWKSVTLGSSRLRTETAALVAVHMMNIIQNR